MSRSFNLICFPTRHDHRRALILLLSVQMASLATSRSTPAAENKYWELSPYRIQLSLAVDVSKRPQPALAERLATDIKQRIHATLSPLWSVDFKLPTGPSRYRLLKHMPEFDLASVGDAVDQFDKLMFLTVVATPEGYSLTSRELDCYTRRWGGVQRRTIRQQLMASEQCFDLLCDTFAPLAIVHAIPDDLKNVLLSFKGNRLPRRSDERLFAHPNDVYQPLLIRKSRTGEIRPEGIVEVPWTYLTLDEPQDGRWRSNVWTGVRRPFGVRRRGRVEQLAIALRQPPGETRVRFHARHDKSQGLAGYEVFQRESENDSSQLLGQTDALGTIQVAPGNAPVVMLFLRGDGQLLAKVPIVPGATPTVEIPIADDTARLRAQAELTALREQLIDLVARRKILMARVRQYLDQNNLEQAQELLGQLDDLPGRTQFDQMISSAEKNRRNRSSDPRVQTRITKLFANTRKLLGRFLDARQISELQNELNAARRGAAS